MCFLGGEKNNVDCFVFAFSGHGHIEEENEGLYMLILLKIMFK